MKTLCNNKLTNYGRRFILGISPLLVRAVYSIINQSITMCRRNRAHMAHPMRCIFNRTATNRIRNRAHSWPPGGCRKAPNRSERPSAEMGENRKLPYFHPATSMKGSSGSRPSIFLMCTSPPAVERTRVMPLAPAGPHRRRNPLRAKRIRGPRALSPTDSIGDKCVHVNVHTVQEMR